MVFIILILFSTSLRAQQTFSLKKEGNSIMALNRPKDYSVTEDTISSMLRVGKERKYIDYYFRRTKMNNSQCCILLHSRLSPVFDSLTNIDNKKQQKIIYNNIKNNSPSPWFKGKIISYRISSMQQHPDGYYYVDIFETNYRKNYRRNITIMSRIFVIDGIEHEISVYTKGYPYNKTVCSSRKAVCHVFEELVNNLVVELK